MRYSSCFVDFMVEINLFEITEVCCLLDSTLKDETIKLITTFFFQREDHQETKIKISCRTCSVFEFGGTWKISPSFKGQPWAKSFRLACYIWVKTEQKAFVTNFLIRTVFQIVHLGFCFTDSRLTKICAYENYVLFVNQIPFWGRICHCNSN